MIPASITAQAAIARTVSVAGWQVIFHARWAAYPHVTASAYTNATHRVIAIRHGNRIYATVIIAEAGGVVIRTDGLYLRVDCQQLCIEVH